MQVTLDNLSDAVASANAHYGYAIAMDLAGNRRMAGKHQRHADAIMRDVMNLTKPDCNLSSDELLAELNA